MGTYYPSHDLVAAGYLSALDLPADGIDTDLPPNPADWQDQGFVQVTAVGGPAEIHIPVHRPVVQVDVWCNRANTDTVPWNQAGHLAGALVAALYDSDSVGVAPILPDGFRPVRVLSAYPLSAPRRVQGDPAGFARYTVDVALRWTYA